MPLIEVHLVEKVFSPEQKRQIVQKLTDAMVSIGSASATRLCNVPRIVNEWRWEESLPALLCQNACRKHGPKRCQRRAPRLCRSNPGL